MNNIAEMLDDEIRKTIDELAKVKTGSDEAKQTMIKLKNLHEQRIKEQETALKRLQLDNSSLEKTDELKIRNAELDLKVRQAAEDLGIKKTELELKEAELKEAKKGRRWRTFLDILGITVPTGFTAWWVWKGMKFEEEGKIYSSRTAQWVGNLTRLFRKG